ncbi:hypothetical protein MLD38_036857 [Melastoma candidum]|uniref:Uncharacterized protein n=1 Tax=Melastoma candidum TaxID=119954 RepID=A0ACB9LL86_9MYRT|nr:hypothetical protein MLD38_036857 [Melastoma candidum]
MEPIVIPIACHSYNSYFEISITQHDVLRGQGEIDACKRLVMPRREGKSFREIGRETQTGHSRHRQYPFMNLDQPPKPLVREDLLSQLTETKASLRNMRKMCLVLCKINNSLDPSMADLPQSFSCYADCRGLFELSSDI